MCVRLSLNNNIRSFSVKPAIKSILLKLIVKIQFELFRRLSCFRWPLIFSVNSQKGGINYENVNFTENNIVYLMKTVVIDPFVISVISRSILQSQSRITSCQTYLLPKLTFHDIFLKPMVIRLFLPHSLS